MRRALPILLVALCLLLTVRASAQSTNAPTVTGVSLTRGSGHNHRVEISYLPPKKGPRPKFYEIWMMKPGQTYPGTKMHQGNDTRSQRFTLPPAKMRRGTKYRFMVRAVLPNGASRDSNTEWSHGYCQAFRTKRASFGPNRPRIDSAKAVCKRRKGKVTECHAELRMSRSSSSGLKRTIVHSYPKGQEPKWYPGGGSSGTARRWKGPRVIYGQTRCYRVRDEFGVGKPVSRHTKRETYGTSEPSAERCIVFDQLPKPKKKAKPRPQPRHICD